MYYLTVSEFGGSWNGSAGWFWLKLPHKATFKLLTRAAVSEDLYGAEESLPRPPVQLLAGGFSSLPQGTIYVAFPKGRDQRGG